MTECQYTENGKCTCPAGRRPTLFDGELYCAPLLFFKPPQKDIDERLLTLVPRQLPSCAGKDCAGVTSACWYLSGHTECAHNAALRIICGAQPPAETFADGRCAIVPTYETLCADGEENGQDCRVDEADPDCQDPESTPSSEKEQDHG